MRQIGTMPALLARTRYLTPVDGNIWPLVTEHLDSTMDPHGTLRGMLNGGRYVFTDDNLVKYSEAISSIAIEGCVSRH